MKLEAVVCGPVMLCLVATACGGSDPEAGGDDTEVGSTGTVPPPPPSATSGLPDTDGTTTGPADDSSTGDEMTGSSTGMADYDGPYNAPPDCQPDEFIIEFPDGLSICSASCSAEQPCPNPGIAGVTPMCAVMVNGGLEPSQCILGCDPAADTCPGETTCEFFGGGNFCAGGDPGIGGTGDTDTGDPLGGCAEACQIMKDCEFGGTVSLLTEAECVAECEANVAASPGFCQPRLDNFLMCVVDEPCLFAEDNCLISSSEFQVCLI